MSLIEQILPDASRVPYAEIVHPAKGGMWADVRHFEGWYGAEKGDALKGLCTVAYCREQPFEHFDIENHKMIENLGKTINLISPTEFNKNEFRDDTVIICHGPLGERAGGLPGIGIDHHYPSWLNTADNDGEVTLVSTLPQETLEKAIDLSIKNFQKWDAYNRGSTWNTEIKSTDWIEPPWNDMGSTPNINRYKRTSYTYWRKKEFPALDFHTISSPDGVNEFLTIYGDIYSNIFGYRALACFIKEDGTLTQRIWQPIKPERAPENNCVRFTKPERMFDMLWGIPETVRLAREAVRVSKVTSKVAEIDPDLIPSIKYALLEQARNIRGKLGQSWIDKFPFNRYKSTLFRANLIDKKNGIAQVNAELEKVNFFGATEIKPSKEVL